MDQLALLMEFLGGQVCYLVVVREDFQGFLVDFQQLVEEFQQLAQGLEVDYLEEDFAEQKLSKSIAEQDGDG